GKRPPGWAHAGPWYRPRKPRAPVRLTVNRHGTTRQFRMRTTDAKGKAVVGVAVNETYKFPFQVKINIGNIGGPSAGLMFALGIMDKLTPGGGLTGGRFIAGTGEIAANGAVSPIG